jgi:lysophospholipid acyltransferase (LPLAT)-like uncharacterized protein
MMTNPLLLASNAAIYALNLPAVRFSRVRFASPPEALPRPAILFAWHRFNYAVTPALAHMPPSIRPTLVMHDGLASRALTHESSEWLGFERFAFARRAAASPRDQIAEYVRTTSRSIFLLPDAGGPYGKVKPGIVAIARACGVPVVPVRVRCDRAIVVGRRLRHVVPLPGATIDVDFGEPIPPDFIDTGRCQAALDRQW